MVSVAAVHPFLTGLPVWGATHNVGFCRHEHLDQAAHHIPEKIDTFLLQLIAQSARESILSSIVALSSVTNTTRPRGWSSGHFISRPLVARTSDMTTREH